MEQIVHIILLGVVKIVTPLVEFIKAIPLPPVVVTTLLGAGEIVINGLKFIAAQIHILPLPPFGLSPEQVQGLIRSFLP
jgi:hypothetical protein